MQESLKKWPSILYIPAVLRSLVNVTKTPLHKEQTVWTEMSWIIGDKSQLPLEGKIQLYEAIREILWTNDIQLCGTADKLNIANLQHSQNKVLRMTVCAPYYIPK